MQPCEWGQLDASHPWPRTSSEQLQQVRVATSAKAKARDEDVDDTTRRPCGRAMCASVIWTIASWRRHAVEQPLTWRNPQATSLCMRLSPKNSFKTSSLKSPVAQLSTTAVERSLCSCTSFDNVAPMAQRSPLATQAQRDEPPTLPKRIHARWKAA
jgi:hypothetical protein